MKRFYKPHFKDTFSCACQFGRLISQAQVEWTNAKLLLSNGIKTYVPVCFGERTKLGFERQSFFITEELPGMCFTDFVTQNWSTLPQQHKEKIISSLAKLVRKAHNAGISLPDLYIWHFFLSEKNPDSPDVNYDFAVIDLHRMKHNVKSANQKIRNLGAFEHSLLDKYFDESIRRVFIKAYADSDSPDKIDKLDRKVKTRSAAISARRKQKPY